MWQSARLREVGLGLVGVRGPVRFRFDGAGDAVAFILGGLGLLTLLVCCYLLLRPGTDPPARSAEDERRVRGLLDRYGERDSLGYFALRRGALPTRRADRRRTRGAPAAAPVAGRVAVVPDRVALPDQR